MTRMITFLLILFLVTPSGWAQSPDELWKSAADQYQNEDYDGARAIYLLLKNDVASSELFFNLGNCYYHLDSVAKSILYFEKAIKLNPRNDDARDNLELAVDRMDNPIPAIDEFFLKRWLNTLSDMLPPMGWGILSMAILWLMVWMLVRSVRRGSLAADRVHLILPVVGFVILLVMGYTSYQNLTESDYAIVMDAREVKVAPDILSATTRTVDSGEKVMIIDKLDNFYKVRFVNYEHGWLPLSAVERI